MKITKDMLLDLIWKAFDDTSPAPELLAEPSEQGEEPPITEGQNPVQRIVRAIDSLPERQQELIWKHYGRHTIDEVLVFIKKTQNAIKAK